ncbi:oligoendopeptidase F [Alkalihalobacillus sp. LMS39]|uniref:oligoendopeptidase F n=1 Tax=Alkalihalobacillus sp. LMS39 TaxID=2924032 RepID=UPI001FB441DB|nr:oligoendopeptidase F [Alkalihalobacillus sp. LMS39]UOE96259.1 oligoendopeptidase F [Alkalihalobacillus sp. LMS39]
MFFSSREEIPEQEKWNFSDLYESTTEWEQDLQQSLKLAETLKSYDNRISNAQTLFEFLKTQEELSFIFKKVYVYAMLHVDVDTRDTSSQALLDRAKQVSVKINSATSFFMPFLLSLKEETLKGYIAEVAGLQYFEDDLFESYRFKKHVLAKEQEEVLSQLGETLSSPSHTFSMMNNADIKFGKVTNDRGEEVELTRGMYAKLIEDENRVKRKEAYKAYYKPYIQMQNTIASTLASAIKTNVTLSKIRHYPSALHKALFSDNVPTDVYSTLIKTTNDHLNPLHRYVDLRKKWLEVDELRAYDLNAPLVEGVKLEIPYDEAYKKMLESLTPLGEEYVGILKSFKEKRYLDVWETPGKRSGAYNIGVYGVHPFILLNHRNDIDSLFTLTHECGHGMHSYYSSTYQPKISAGYSIFVAEVASTVNEVLLIRHMLQTTTDKKMKKYLLNHFIDSFKGTFFTQVMFSEFEKITHEKAENGEPLNVHVFNETYESIFKKYHGDTLVLDEEVKHGWSRIPHFYRPFYVYKYATGFASAVSIADKLLEGEEKTREQYLTFLKAGSSDYPLELLKTTGVDLKEPNTIEHALSLFDSLVDEFAKL